MSGYELWKRVEKDEESDDFAWMVCESGAMSHQTISWFRTQEEAEERLADLQLGVTA